MASEQFNTFVASLPVATLPLTGIEAVPILQGGVSKQTTPDAINSLMPFGEAVDYVLEDQGADLAPTVIYTNPSPGFRPYQMAIFFDCEVNDAGAGNPVATVNWTDPVTGAASRATGITLNGSPNWNGTGFLAQPQILGGSGTFTVDVTGGGTYGVARWNLRILILPF